MKTLFPGKTFLLGEYAILEGGCSLMLAHGPGFAADFSPGSTHPFHPESPAGKWLQSQTLTQKISFEDFHSGQGGFGGSGAEFLAAFAAVKGVPESLKSRIKFAWDAWEASRNYPGSGADILTQAMGVNFAEPFWLGIDIGARSLETLYSDFGLTLSLFHTGQKLATHSHLENLPNIPSEALTYLVWDGLEAIRSGSKENFAASIKAYGALLADAKLVAAHTEKALASLPAEIVAAKGCGAMGSDVIAVFHEAISLDRWAKENSLAEILRIPV